MIQTRPIEDEPNLRRGSQDPRGRDDHAHDHRAGEQREPARDATEDEPPRKGGQFMKGKCYNRYGRAGNPRRRAERATDKFEDFDAHIVHEMRRIIEYTENGKKQKAPAYALLARKLIPDLLNAPLRLRLVIMSERHGRLFRLLELAAAPDDKPSGPWTPELEEKIRLIEWEYISDEPERDAESQRERSERYSAWCDEQAAIRGPAFSILTEREKMLIFADQSGEIDRPDLDLRNGMLGDE